jgi:two-component system, LytTR family, response regulator
VPQLRALIVDDEPLARERLRSLLGSDPTVEIVGECASGTEAIAKIRSTPLDVVFLDMQMPGCDGLRVVKELPEANRPAIVFATAHERFAVDAFEVQAVDYLLKPFDRERLQTAVRRVHDYLRAQRIGNLEQKLDTLLANSSAAAATPERNPGDRLAFKAEGRVIFLKPEEIVWVEAANNYSILHLADAKRLMLRETLSALEERLRAFHFARVNRSALVRVDEVRELQPSNYGDYVVILRNGFRLSLSRSLRGRFEEFVAKR